MCPNDYRTDPADLARKPDMEAQTLYVVGGLYGNALALEAIEALAAAEPAPVTLLFNGDAHWFDADPEAFAALDARLARHPAIAGNVEYELAREHDAGAGCGCAYPELVPDDIVDRSNEILLTLRRASGGLPAVRARLAALPKTMVARVGGLRVGVVHGDANALAGWGFARESLDDPASATSLDAVRRAAQVDVFASTHTCGAVMRDVRLASGRLIIANNGAAGMGNFDGDARGLFTRISTLPSPHPVLYGIRYGRAHIDALPAAFDLPAFLRSFDAIWPKGSPAEISYRERILGRLAGSTVELAMPAFSITSAA
jgi:hypothetical protein